MIFSAPRAYPTHVRVYPRTEHSVRVTWRGISTTVDEEALEGYIVSFVFPKIIWASLRENLSSGFPSKRISNWFPQLLRLAKNFKFGP